MMDHNLILRSNNWKEFKTILEPLNNTEEGRIFEELTRLYLLTEPTFSTKIEEVWHHTDIPQKIVDELGLQQPEIGVDLIAQVKDGTYWAIQCKYHEDQNRNVSYKELSTFLSITERDKTYPKLSHRLVCTSANEISRRVQKAHPEKLGYLTSADFSKLGNTEFETIRDLLGGESPLPTPFSPKPHQSRAIDNCVAFFKDKNNTRGKIIHPCGSGKSLTGYWIAEKLQSKTILLAVPSLALVRQTLSTWTREAVANGIEMDWIAVCSDEDVKSSDDPLMQRVDLGIEVNTDPNLVSEFLLNSSEGTKVIMTTYQSGEVVSEGLKKSGKTFDLGIFDEAHKTVGQKDKKFAHLLYDENAKVEKRIFMTATERTFKGNSDEYLSMDDPEIYGIIIDELSFKEALEQKEPILSDYKIVTTLIMKSEIEELIKNNNFVKTDAADWTVETDAPTFAALIALRKLIKEHNIKHTVSFHNSIKRSKDFQKLNGEISKNGDFGNLSSFHVSGKDSTGVRAAELERFVETEPSLITNARCLTEGVDVPAIDAVLFADAKQSKIDIVQAAGRALRKFKDKKFGYIIIPVVVDEKGKNLAGSIFDQLINVISSLGMNDKRIIDEFQAFSKNKEVFESVTNFSVPEIFRVQFNELIENIEIQIWDRLSFGWIKGFSSLKDYLKKNNHVKVPSKYKDEDGFALGRWISDKRKKYRNGKLALDFVKQLESIESWVWVGFGLLQKNGLKQLKKFASKNQHVRVKGTFKDENNYSLGRWVSYQRREYKLGNLSRNRILQLESIKGWMWDIAKEDFEYGLRQLYKHVKRNGHAWVHPRYEDQDGFKLGNWTSHRRRAYLRGELSLKDIKHLESIKGWVWDADEGKFQIGLESLKKYIDEFGHALVPALYEDKDGYRLGKWVSHKRRTFKKGKLSSDQIKQLESVKGWVWKVKYTN